MAIQTRYDGVISSDLYNAETTDGVLITDILREADSLAAEYNRRFNDLVAAMGFVTTRPEADVVSQITVKWQRFTEFGKPDVRTRSEYDEAVTTAIEGYQTAIEWTDFAQVLLNDAGTLRAYSNGVMEGDIRHLYTQMWEQFYDKNSRTVEDVLMRKSVTQLPFYNGDSRVPPPIGNKTFSSAHNHYLRSATQNVLVAADVDGLLNTVLEHGYTDRPIIFGTQATMDDVFALGTDYAARIMVMDPMIPRDAVNANQVGALMPVGREINSIMSVQGVWRGRAWLAVTNDVPEGYLGAFSMQNSAMERPLQIRLPAQAALRGLQRRGDVQYPFAGQYWINLRGVGTRRFGNGAALQYKSWVGGSYDVPSFSYDVF